MLTEYRAYDHGVPMAGKVKQKQIMKKEKRKKKKRVQKQMLTLNGRLL